jgi:hypothetical protein
MIIASDWCPVEKNTLRGFLTLTLSPSGIVLHECSLHDSGERRWVGLPSKPQIDAEGKHRPDPGRPGKKLYTPLVDVKGTDERKRFQAAALAAVDKLLGDTP